MDARPEMTDAMRRLDRVETVANILDTAIRVPGVGVRVGLDSILGLVPGIGDTVALMPGLYILYEGYKVGLPRRALMRMGRNAAIDYAVGTIPVLGDVFDVAFKANQRNAGIVREHVAAAIAGQSTSDPAVEGDVETRTARSGDARPGARAL